MSQMRSIDEMVAEVTTVDQGRDLLGQVEGLLVALPPEPDADTDHRLRAQLEAFAAGLRLGLRLTGETDT